VAVAMTIPAMSASTTMTGAGSPTELSGADARSESDRLGSMPAASGRSSLARACSAARVWSSPAASASICDCVSASYSCATRCSARTRSSVIAVA
jgi:hypothetical protein